MAGDDTKERILSAAEKVFAQQGFAGASLRELTREAGVNLAAIHYHYGSKEELLRAVLARIIGPVNQKRLAMLAEVEAKAGKKPPVLESILHAFIAPDLELIRDLGERGRIITRFVGRSYTESTEMVQALIKEFFGELGQKFVKALKRALPKYSEAEIYERLHWLIGIITYILADAGPTHTQLTDIDGLTKRLVAFVAAGMRA
jgi:AcrR family transcriptional regulator